VDTLAPDETLSSLVLSAALSSPLSDVVATSSSVVAWVPVKSSTLPVAAVTRPRMIPVETWASIALVTLFAPIAEVPVTLPEPLNDAEVQATSPVMAIVRPVVSVAALPVVS
jgi:hypothetical protein